MILILFQTIIQEGFSGKTKDANKIEIMAIAALSNNLKYLKEVNTDLKKISKKWILLLIIINLNFF